MLDIYKNHMQQEGVTSSARDRLPAREADEDEDPPALRRTSTDPTVNRFQRLPNPDLEMHVYPHLASGKYPVPGYVTVFPMYESVQYALPGEVAPSRSIARPATATLPPRAPKSDDADGDGSLQIIQRLSPRIYRVAVDFRDDYAKACDARLDGRSVVRIVEASPTSGELHDFERRVDALNVSESAYTSQRKKLACADVQRALVDLNLAAR